MSSMLPNTTSIATMLSKRFDPKDIPDLSGRVAIVTGGSAGIGYYDALELARAGAKVTILSANPEHGHNAEADINRALREATKPGSVEWVQCNFDSLKTVNEVAKKLGATDDRLDILLCNAGIGQAPYKETSDGLNAHFEINNLAHYVLTLRLLGRMKKAAAIAPPASVRIVYQSSMMHQFVPKDTKFLSKDEINTEHDGVQLYGRTKLGLIYLGRQLVKRKLSSQDPPILVMSVHPGAVETDLQNTWAETYGAVGKIIQYITNKVGKSAPEGAEASLWAATSTDIHEGNWKDYQGNYYAEPYGAAGQESDLAKNEQIGDNFWNLCAQLSKELLGEDVQ